MPLRNIDGKRMNSLPKQRQLQFNKWRNRISDADYQQAVMGIQSRCQGQNVLVSSFLPGSNWTGTEFQPLYYACSQNQQHAAWFFGLIVWQVMIDDPINDWRFLKPADDEDIQGMKYFIHRTTSTSNQI